MNYPSTPTTLNINKPRAIKSDIVIGKDILELLTGAMYIDPMCIYREYVQNAVDAIDEAEKNNLYEGNSPCISIELDQASRSVKIRDNGIGVPNKDFSQILTAIGGSQKRGKGQRGFRGVGRLAGLGYCQELIFRSRATGDANIYELSWDGRKLKETIRNPDFKGSLVDIIKEIAKITIIQADNSLPHFFEVELVKVGRLKNDLLLNEDEVRTYLAQVGPVPFHPEFELGNQIQSRLAEYGKAKTYNISINDGRGQIYRPHQMEFFVSEKLKDHFTDIEFFEIIGQDGNQDAVGWILNHSYHGAITKKFGLSGVRIRSGNIQVGSAELIADIFPESRFNSWAVSEIHVLSGKIVPNGRRDDFEYSVHYQNLLGQVSVNASKISKKCRDKSSARNRVKIARDYLAKCRTELEFACDENLSFTSRKLALENCQNLIVSATKAIQSDLLTEQDKEYLLVDVDDLATRLELVRKSFNGITATKILAQEYIEIFGHIHEICRDSGEAHRIVEQLVKRLKL